MPTIHPKARTTPAVRAEIARSSEPSGVLAQRYGVSTETIRKWRKRGPADCQDHSSRPHKLPWKATDEERAIVCALRRATGFSGAVSEISCVGRAVDPIQAMARVKRSPKRMANCALAIHHSRAGIVHSFSDRFKTKNNSFKAASSVGK
jgi:transposase-like protein